MVVSEPSIDEVSQRLLGGLPSEERKSQFRQIFFPLLPATLASVVAYELNVNAKNGHTRALLQEFITPMQRTGRFVNPTFSDWLEAAAVITAIEAKARGWRSKLPSLLNDILIALCARRIGAILLTYNKDDFQLIRRYKNFSLRGLVV
jgi:predicted nucleic acid-binding protein